MRREIDKELTRNIYVGIKANSIALVPFPNDLRQ